MAINTQGVTTSSTLATTWRKVQAKLVDGINVKVEEMAELSDMKDARLLPSTREVLRPVNLTFGYGVASIGEGAYEAQASTAAANELSFTLVQFNKRISISKLVNIIDMAGGDTQIENQLGFQSKQAFDALSAYIGDSFWQPKTAIKAQTDTDLAGASTTLTLDTGANQSWITDAGYIARKFAIGGRVAVLDAGVLVPNAVGAITGLSAITPSITVTWDGSAPSSTTNDLQIVDANSLDNATSDYNKGFDANWIDAVTAASLHGLAASAAPNWSAAYTDTTGGRLTGTRLQKAIDAAEDFGPYPIDTIWMAKGVYRDMVNQYQSGVRFDSPYAMAVDGDIKAKGIQFKRSRRVPPGTAWGKSSKAVERFFGKPTVESQKNLGWSDLRKMENQSGYLGSIDWVGNVVCNARKSLFYFRGLSEQ